MALGIRIPLFGDNTHFRRTLEDTRRQVGNWSRDVSGMFSRAFAFGAISAGAVRLVNSLDQIGKTAQRLGMTTEEFQRLSVAAEKSGATIEQLQGIMFRVQRRTGEVALGNKEFAKAFNLLNIEADKFSRLSIENQMIELARAFQEAEKNGQGAALMSRAFDDEIRALFPLLRQGEEAIRDLFSSAGTYSPQAIAAAERLKDLWVDIKGVFVEFTDASVRGFGIVINRAQALAAWLGVDNKRLQELNEEFAKLAMPELNQETTGPGGTTTNPADPGGASKKTGGMSAAERAAAAAADEAIDQDERRRRIRAAEEELKKAGMSAEERMRDLLKERAFWQERVARGGNVELEAREKLLEIAKELVSVNDEIRRNFEEQERARQAALALEKKDEEGKTDTLEKGRQFVQAVTASGLQEVGGGGGVFGGFATDPALREQQKTTENTARAAAALERIEQRLGGNTPFGGSTTNPFNQDR